MAKLPQPRIGLSKSRIAAFEQCPRRLWQQVPARERALQDAGAEARFAVGHSVGELACALCPGGVMIDAEDGLAAAAKRTAALIESGHRGPIFEATFEHDGVLVRVDILEKAGRKGWQACEVKSASSAKDYHRSDLATQVWVMQQAGLRLAGAAIRHIDTDFVLEREEDYDGLFADAELLDDLDDEIAARPALVKQARKMLAGTEPDIAPGDHCAKPFACEFADWCNRDLPPGPDWPVTILPGTSGRKWLAQGIEDLLDLDEADLSSTNARILAATRDDVPYHDIKGAKAAMVEWGWPRAWLDFETINPAIPRWIGTRPYQQVPFQFSLHIEARNGRIAHHEFLDTSGDDPRLPLVKALLKCMPDEGAIVAYNAPFEIRVLNDLADAFPRYAKRLRAMVARVVDLLPVTKANWYHRDQWGSWSIKRVLPSLCTESYLGLEVKDGGDAQMAWLEASDPACDPARRELLRDAMLIYCKRDTDAMIAVARALTGRKPLA